MEKNSYIITIEKSEAEGYKVTVYVDVLLLENIAINFIILAATSHFSRVKVSTVRLFLGALIGAVYVVAAFFPGFEIYFTLIAKLILSLVIIAVTFWPEKIKDFIRLTGVFYLVSFVFGGAAFGLFYFLESGGMLYNGVFYINNFPLRTLILSSAIAYIVIRISWDFVKSKMTKENIMIPVSIKFREKSVSIKALIDTGNSLKDPISNMPVVVVEYCVLKDILPEEISEVFSVGSEDNLDLVSQAVVNTNWASRFRLIPFTSLGKENGILIGFKPDGIEVGEQDKKRDYQDVIVGIYNKKLSHDQSYKALLGLDLVS